MALLKTVCFRSWTSPFSSLLLPARLHTNAGIRYEIATKNSEQDFLTMTDIARNVFHYAAPKTWKLGGSSLLIFQDVLTPCGVNVHVQGMHSCTAASNANASSKGSSSGRSANGSVLTQMVNQTGEQKQLTVAGKVVQAGKDMTYLMVILGGFALTGFLFWSVGSEFMSSNSPSAIFTIALKRVKNDPRVIQALGEPITGHGELSGRGRRRHIPHQEYIVDGVSYMRLKFFVDGSKRKGTATIDLKKNGQGKYECRFLMVEFSGGTIVVEDNR